MIFKILSIITDVFLDKEVPVNSSRVRTRTPDGIAEFAGLEFAGVENDGQSRRGGICRTGK